MKIVTSGFFYIDIDALACCVAYAELLNLQDDKAMAVSSAPQNLSIPDTVKYWGAQVSSSYKPAATDEFILVDVSDPNQVEAFVDTKRVTEVIDHHSGFGDYWKRKIGDKSQIEQVGAVATLVFEKWKDAGMLDQMGNISKKLLITAILDNTLYFKAEICTKKDIAACHTLLKTAGLPNDWPELYFAECQKMIENNLKIATAQDTKKVFIKSLGQHVVFGQLVLWNAEPFVKMRLQTLKKYLNSKSKLWFINIAGISNNTSYFAASNASLKSWISQLAKVNFEGDTTNAKRLWLRKEILQKDRKSDQ